MSAACLGAAVFIACRTTWTTLLIVASVAAGGRLELRKPGRLIAVHAALAGLLFGAAAW